MKLRLLALSFFIVLMACSSDDGSEPVNENPEVVKDIYKFTTYSYGETTPSSIATFSDNKIDETISYVGGQFNQRQKYIYNEQGVLTEIHLLDEQGNFISKYMQFVYDELGRMISYQLFYIDGTSATYEEMVYNEDNTISRYRTLNVESTLYKKYFLNDTGRIYKMETYTNGNTSTVEAIYNGNNITSLIYDNYTYNYTYDTATEVKGDFLKLNRNHFDNNEVNIILYGGFIYIINNADNYYIKEEATTGFTHERIFEFDEDGFPNKISTSYDGEPAGDIIIEYTTN
ncbi:hypothetical protein [Flavobacterium beibuense]|uniref:Lipoprotein n=1 Tax=Flavobacterium beibuense TaxID=657326 RepID=A0A444W8X7_9FLAO|nr:hypothetical protein [Flavobacterium beibuense]RYJ42339.1 hypothetical protein NU09_2125 [Flavobacterium beibuense]